MDFIREILQRKYREVLEEYKIKYLQQLNDNIKNDKELEIEKFVEVMIYILQDTVTDEEIVAVFK